MEAGPPSIAFLAEFALRGGAAGISLLMAGLLLAIRPAHAATLSGALFALGAAVYSLVSVEVVQDAIGIAVVPFKLFAMLAPAFFWLFIVALFDDEFEWKPFMAAPFVLIALLYLLCLPFPPVERFTRPAHVGIVLILMGHALLLTRRSLANDLVAARRQFTGIVAVLVPLVCLAIGVIEAYELFRPRNEFASPAIGCMLFLVAATFGFGVAGIRKSLLPAAARPAPQPGSVGSPADRFDLARLEKLMADGVYLQPGLTIGELAGRLNMPEHRLRRLINSGLGYRNFAAFINDHRIEEAKRRLAKPETAREQITSLAFDLGYSSLAPFNRAFRERIGMSPSQYREKALQRV